MILTWKLDFTLYLQHFFPLLLFLCLQTYEGLIKSIWEEFLFQLGFESSYQSIDKYSRKGKEVWNNKLRLCDFAFEWA